MNSLANLNQYYIPNTLDGINTITQEVSTNALLVDGSNKMLANLDMNSHKIKNVANGSNASDAVNKSQLDLKADTTYVDTNFLNKVISTTQTIGSKVNFTNSTTEIFNNPVINMLNTIGGSANGMFLRFQKAVVETSNTQIGGLSACDKNIGNTLIRVADLIFSRGSSGEARMDLKVINGTKNPLTITDGEFISRNNTQTFLKQDLTNLLNYTTASDKWTMYKPLDMFSNNIKNLLDPSDLNDAANKLYVDTQTANTHYLLRNGSLAMTGNLNLATHNLTTTGDINCNDITADGNINTTADVSCADFTSAANQVIGGTSANVLDVKSSAFFEANVLIETNKHLAFNSGTLSTTDGMLMNYDSGVGYIDVRGSEFRIRTASAGVPNTIRFKVNDTNTSVINNFFVNGNTTLGNNVANDTTTFNSIANFPSGSELKFNSGSTLLLQSGATTTFASGSNTAFDSSANLQFKSNSSSYYLAGAFLEYANVQSFLTGSYIDSARVRLIKSGNTSFQLSNLSVENGVLCNNSSTINITMPTKQPYWNNRSYYIKTQTATVNLVQTTGTSIDNDNTTLVMSSNYRGYHLHFDSDYENNGDIWRLSQI